MAPRGEAILWSVKMGTSVLIGREQECRMLTDLIGQKKNVLILGDEGVGKSAILETMLAGERMGRVLYSKRSATLKETLLKAVTA